MTFVHPLLLGGLLLVGIPVLIHLIMQQKPKHLLFPAFRFLLQKQQTNQRRLRLRHWLLLALRMLLVAAICLALARPKLFSNRLGIGSDRPVAAVLLFDTSYSMDYRVAQQTRLDEAKKRALELLEVLPEESRIAILDSAEPGGEWLTSRAQAEDRIAALKLRPINAPVTRQIGQAYRLFNELDQGQSDQNEELPRFLYVISDRTTACWDTSEAKALRAPEGLNSIFVDVGVDDPADLAITKIELPRQVVHPGFAAELRVAVRAIGVDGDNELLSRSGEDKAERKPVHLAAGKSEVMVIRRDAGQADSAANREHLLLPGFHQFEIQFGSNDALPANNIAYATIKVQEGRRILVVTDHPGKRPEEGDAALWYRALMATHAFPCKVCSPAEFDNFSLGDLKRDYEAICLLDVADPSKLWDRLADYVQAGKGLAIVPGGEDWLPSLKAYNSPAARSLLGVQFVQPESLQDNNKPVSWKELETDADKATLHPVVRRFRDAKEEGRFKEDAEPGVSHFWKVKPEDGARVIAYYANQEMSPALVEKQHGKARVLTFTTSMDNHLVKNYHANNYFAPGSWFGVGLIVFTTGYLAGDAETPNFNFICGQSVTVPVPATPTVLFRLFGPGVTDANVPRGKGENEVRIPQAVLPGNYILFDPNESLTDPKPVACFSLNVAPEESQLDRVPVEQIESLLGRDSVWTVDRAMTLGDAFQGRWLQPLELFPWLMIVVLLALAVENFLSNKFYRRGAQEPGEKVGARIASAKPSAAVGMAEKELV